MQVLVENITDIEQIRENFIELKKDKKITDQSYGLKGYWKFLPLLKEGPEFPKP